MVRDKIKLVICLAAIALLSSCAKIQPVAVQDYPDGYRVRITTDRDWEFSRAYYYSIERNGHILVPRCFIENEPTLHRTGSIIYGVDVAATNEVSFIYDIDSGESSPYRIGSETMEESHTKSARLLKKLSEHEKQMNFRLK